MCWWLQFKHATTPVLVLVLVKCASHTVTSPLVDSEWNGTHEDNGSLLVWNFRFYWLPSLLADQDNLGDFRQHLQMELALRDISNETMMQSWKVIYGEAGVALVHMHWVRLSQERIPETSMKPEIS